MVAPGSLVDTRCAAKFAHGDNQHVLTKATLVEVGHEGGEAAVVVGPLGLHAVGNLAVVIPAADAHGNKANPGLHEPAGEKHALSGGVAAVTFARCIFFPCEIKGCAGTGAGK